MHTRSTAVQAESRAISFRITKEVKAITKISSWLGPVASAVCGYPGTIPSGRQRL